MADIISDLKELIVQNNLTGVKDYIDELLLDCTQQNNWISQLKNDSPSSTAGGQTSRPALLGYGSHVSDIIFKFPLNKTNNYMMDPSYIFQKVYIHACLKQRHDIAKYLQEECFHLLPQIEQIAIRQVFSYGRYLLKK